MRRIFTLALLTLIPLLSARPVSAGFIINHQHIDQVDSIPQTILDTARHYDVIFTHKSVGVNILSGLDDLELINSGRYNLNRLSGATPDWFVQNDGVGDYGSGTNQVYTTKITTFNNVMNTHGNYLDVAMMKFCYVDIYVLNGGGALQNPATIWNDYHSALTNQQTNHPNVKVIYWTMPLQGSSSTDAAANVAANQLNTTIRSHIATSPNEVLFDLADIESHAPNGNLCCQADPNGINGTCTTASVPIICSGYTNDGGHLSDSGNVGRQRVAKGWWALTAYLAGWQPNSPPSTGDLDGDGDTDFADLKRLFLTPFTIFNFNNLIQMF